ncbi:hypothetical protein BDZ89DRAFT_1167619, partial [Hymenopellis radicata]
MPSHLSEKIQSLPSLPRAWLMMVLTRLDVPPPLPPKPTRKRDSNAQSKPPLRPQLSAPFTPSKPRQPPVVRDSAAPFTTGKLGLLVDPFNLPSEVLAPPSGQSRRRQYFGLRSAEEVRTEEEDTTAPIPPILPSRHGQLDRQRMADSLRYGAYAKDMEEYRRLGVDRPPSSSRRRNSSQSINHSRFLRTTSGEVMSVPAVLVTTSCQ